MLTDRQNGADGTRLMEEITRHIEELAQATDAARLNQQMLQYLDSISRFHSYSCQNVWLITMACPHATHVAGFRAWQKMNRFVRRGEHGIAILAPIVTTEKDEKEIETRVLRGFKVVRVFDVSQTDGEPLPEPPNWKSPEKNAVLQERLVAFAGSQGIAVTEGDLPGEMQGVSTGGHIELAPSAGTGTLIHEIAHEMMHKGPNAPAERRIRELEAEAVAYVVGSHFGLEGIGSPNYVAVHGATAALLMQSAARIRNTCTQMISFLDQPRREGSQIGHGPAI